MWHRNTPGNFIKLATNLAHHYSLCGRPDLGEAMFREACRTCQAVCGKTNPFTIIALTKMRNFLICTKKFEEADEFDAQIVKRLEAGDQAKQERGQPGLRHEVAGRVNEILTEMT